MLTDWRIAAAAAIFCTGILMTCIETYAQSVPKEIASRVEIYAIPSLTLSDQQFLSATQAPASRSSSPANSASRKGPAASPSW